MTLMMKMMCVFLLPKLANLLRLNAMETEGANFFIDLVKRTIRQRQKSGQRQNDFVDQIIDVFKTKKTGEHR